MSEKDIEQIVPEENKEAAAQETAQEAVQEPAEEAQTTSGKEAAPKGKGFLKKDKNKIRIEELEKKVEECENKIAKDRDDYIRLMAEFDNFRRRTAQEKLDIVSMASTETIKGLLPVLEPLKCSGSQRTAKLQRKEQSSYITSSCHTSRARASQRSKRRASLSTQTCTRQWHSSRFRKKIRRARCST